MNFISVRDLTTSPESILDKLTNDGELIITNNGKPMAILVSVDDRSFEDTLKAIKQAKAMIAFNHMRTRAAENGYMTAEEIAAEIAISRKA